MKNKRKNIPSYIVAYTCLNFGDDLLVLSLLRRFPKHLFYLCASPEETKPFEREENLIRPNKFEWIMLRLNRKLFHRNDRDVINYRIFKGCKEIIKIGGSIFIESNHFNWKEFIPGKTHIIGANFEHHCSAQFLNKARLKISQVQSCTFRDSYSYNLFSNLDNVSLAPDAVFSLDFHKKDRKEKGRGIAISVIFPENRPKIVEYSDYYYQIIAEIVDYCEKNALPVGLFGFCSYEKDNVAIDIILNRVHTKNYPYVYVYDGNIDEFINHIDSYEAVIATRFHAMIVGWKLEKKVLPVIYSEKQTNVLSDVKFQGFSWNLLKGAKIKGDLIAQSALESPKLDETEQLSVAAQSQFSGIDHFTGYEMKA